MTTASKGLCATVTPPGNKLSGIAAVVILGGLIAFGGVSGTGVLSVYIAPFLAFFLAGQRRGWWYSTGFIAATAIYLGWLTPKAILCLYLHPRVLYPLRAGAVFLHPDGR